LRITLLQGARRVTKRDDPAKYERERRAKNPEYFRKLSREYYRRNREKRLAEKKAEYDADPEKSRAYRREQYAKHREERVERARRYRRKKQDEVNAKAKERYYAGGEELKKRRRELSKRPEAREKQYAHQKRWNEQNPDKRQRHYAKNLLAEQVGLKGRDIPDDLADAKVEQLKIARWVREQLAASVGRNAERQDRNGLGPKDEHAVGEAETPESRSND
jgi:hypothetical protein